MIITEKGYLTHPINIQSRRLDNEIRKTVPEDRWFQTAFLLSPYLTTVGHAAMAMLMTPIARRKICTHRKVDP